MNKAMRVVFNLVLTLSVLISTIPTIKVNAGIQGPENKRLPGQLLSGNLAPLPQENIDIDFSMVQIPEKADAVFAGIIANRPPKILHGEHFVVTWAELNNNWIIAMIASVGAFECTREALGIGEHCNAMILLRLTESQWKGALESTSEFDHFLEQAPPALISKYNLQPGALTALNTTNDPASPKFPWHYSQTWRFTQGFYGP